jgi:Na+-translocating ferredoxin:NAD+ oxidoreductase RnfD subunit
MKRDPRLAALRRFAVAITLANLLGHLVFGFEPSWAQLFLSWGVAYSMELAIEMIGALSERRPAKFRGGLVPLVNFLLPAHITGGALGMLMFAGGRLLPFAFAAAAAITTKALFRAPIEGGTNRHFFNPSNAGLVISLFAFPSITIAAPYQYTENFDRYGDWILPLVILCTGSFLNVKFTRRVPLILGWVGGFVAQALVRHLIVGAALLPALLPFSGVAFLLFTFYMVPDPGTTPSRPRAQVTFGVSVALVYGALMLMHQVFAMFIALFVVCAARGLSLYAVALHDRRIARLAVPPGAAFELRPAKLAAPVAAGGPLQSGVEVPVVDQAEPDDAPPMSNAGTS